jgi:agmatine deiminase
MPRRQPAEWEPHSAVVTAWPSAADLWEENLEPARAEVADLVRAIADGGRGEQVILLVAGDEARVSAQAAGLGTGVEIVPMPFGDIWLRDTGPLVVTDGAEVASAVAFRFNGWGGKYILEHDAEVAGHVASRLGLALHRADWVLEGGAIDVDGSGLAITTEECLLNDNRNPGMSRQEVEQRLAADLGLERIVWLGDGLLNDHTDGHVDNLARCVALGRVAVPFSAGQDDPNAAVYDAAAARAAAAGLDVVRIPSPGRVERDGAVVPASYMNFYIANTTVVVPQYAAPRDAEAVAAIGALFPGRRAVGVSSASLLTGGGSFHCITQQIPRTSAVSHDHGEPQA